MLGLIFFALLFAGNYFRSEGFYSTGSMFIEYMMTYFNVYPLHDMFMSHFDRNLLETSHHILMKPMIKLSIVGTNTDYDLSVMLTKQFFPEQWEKMHATQQWPLISEIYLNYYGMIFGWLPLVIYCYIISVLYNKSMAGNFSLMLIYMIEFIRMFSTFRGVFIPWQAPVFICFYIIIYYISSKAIRK
jgi:hypothetical protein